MKTRKILAAVSMFAPLIAQADTFDFAYNNVFQSQASQFDLSVSGLQKYNEGGNGVTYWGASTANQMGTLIMAFSYPSPTQSIFLNAETESYNFGGGDSGQSYLLASTDGVNYTTLISNPTTGNLTSKIAYDGLLPAQLLGSTTLFLKVELEQTSAPGSFAYAQFSREGAPTGNIFEVTTTTPEPSSAALVLISLPALFQRRSRIRPVIA